MDPYQQAKLTIAAILVCVILILGLFHHDARPIILYVLGGLAGLVILVTLVKVIWALTPAL